MFTLLAQEDRKYIVYNSQRFFEWDTEELNDFWSDYIEVVKGSFDKKWAEKLIINQKPHFMGAIVVTKEDDLFPNAYLVIDGQQRLTTCTIFLAALKDLVERFSNSQYQAGLYSNINSFIRKNQYGEEFNPRLQLKERINNHFLNFIQKPETKKERLDYIERNKPSEMEKSFQRIVLAYNFFTRKLDEEFPIGMDEDEMHVKLLAYFNAFSRKLFFLRIFVKRESTAYVIFETLNKRGKSLSESDLIKNKFYNLFLKKSRMKLKRIGKKLSIRLRMRI